MGDATAQESNSPPREMPLDALLNAVPDLLLCVDDQRRVVCQNLAARRFFGGGTSGSTSVPPDNDGALAAFLDHLKFVEEDGAGAHVESRRLVELALADGRRTVLEARCSRVRFGDQAGWVVSAREAVHHQQIQNAIYQAQERQVIGALASGIAHDFNNILAAVIANLDLALLDETITPGLRDYITRAAASARRGADLNSKLLSFSRHAEICLTSVDLCKVVEEALFILRRGLSKSIEIAFHPPAGIWPAKADQNQIVQVLMNLCLNAREAMPQGGRLTLSLANAAFATEQAVPPRRSGEFVQITVEDTGVGMPPEVLRRIFEPYFTTKEYGKGAGLSLSIVGHILSEHGGWLEAESQVGQGSRFHVFLPKAKPADGVQPVSPVAVATARPHSLEGTETILVVDDESSIRIVVRAMLQFRGYKVLEAVSGEEGLLQLEKAGGGIRLVLLDVDMPGLSGWTTLERFRKMAPEVPVVMTSGGVVGESRQRMLQKGAADFIEKPFRAQDLLRTVRQTLDQAKARKG